MLVIPIVMRGCLELSEDGNHGLATVRFVFLASVRLTATFGFLVLPVAQFRAFPPGRVMLSPQWRGHLQCNSCSRHRAARILRMLQGLRAVVTQ